MGKFLLIFDGFDEITARVNRQNMLHSFWELAKVVVPGSKVVLTCRTEHFPKTKEGRSLFNAELQASNAQRTDEAPQFVELRLKKMEDAQIRPLLSFWTRTSKVDQMM